jgi:hypothetical protein
MSEPRQRAIRQAERLLLLMARLGFSTVALRRMTQTIEWMESET